MSIIWIGCDFHPSFQHIAMVDTESGEYVDVKLEHESGQAQRFYAALQGRRVIIGMEACGNSGWFEQMMGEMGHELWLGDAGKIRSLVVRKQKTDRRDAEHILSLLQQGRFPRIWVPSAKMRDSRQLLLHRHKLVQMRTRVKNELQHLALNQGVRLQRKLWTASGRERFEALPLTHWTEQRRTDLLALLDELDGKVRELDAAVVREAEQYPETKLLQKQPGVGPITALAFVLTIGPVTRFPRSKQVASYLGLIPAEHSSGGRQKLLGISKQGNPFLRFLLVEAGQSAARHDPELQRAYQRLAHRKHRALAKVMVARKLAVRLYWILRTAATVDASSHAGQPESSCSSRHD
jgi:transposase